MKDIVDPTANTKSAINGDIEINKAINKLTLDSEPILSKY